MEVELNFQQPLLLQSSVSHDPSEIILIWWCDVEIVILYRVFNEQKLQKKSIYFLIIVIILCLYCIFYQFNVSMHFFSELNKNVKAKLLR